MKKTIASLLGLAALLVTGCVSTPAGSPAPVASADVAKISPFITSLAQTAVPLVLNKHKEYAPVVASVAAAIPAAFTAGNLDAMSISEAVALIGSKAGLDSETESVISAVLLNGVTWYQQTYGQQVALATDPNVKALLAAFATGLSNGVTLWENSQPKTAAN